MTKKNLGIFCIIISLLVIVGYQYFNVKSDEKYEVIVVLKNTILTEYWREVKHGIEKAALINDIDVSFVAAISESDVEGQKKLIEKAILKKPDAIMLAANDYLDLVESAKQIQENGIKLIMIDSGLDYAGYDSFVATNNYEAGFKAGIAMSKEVGAGKSINIMNYIKGAQTAIEREQGVKDALLASGNEYIVTTYYCYDIKDEAYRITEQFMKDNNDVDGIISLNETSTVGVAEAIDDLRLLYDVVVIGYDSSIEEIEFLEKGTIDALVVQKPFNMGYIGIETVNRLIHGDQVEKKIDTGSKLIYKENMYEKENIDLLFPFVE